MSADRQLVPAVPVLAVGVFAAMAATLTYAFATGDFSGEGGRLLDMSWGIATLVEVYAGIALFAGWVAFREPSRLVAAAWVAMICLGGNIVSALYVLVSLRAARGDVRAFWMGPAFARAGAPTEGSS